VSADQCTIKITAHPAGGKSGRFVAVAVNGVGELHRDTIDPNSEARRTRFTAMTMRAAFPDVPPDDWPDGVRDGLEKQLLRIARVPPGELPNAGPARPAVPPPPPKTLDDAVATFRTWMHLPDSAPLELAVAAVVANRMAGDPVWLLLVGAPGSGKTEIVQAVADGCPDVHLVGTLTEASLLSGSSRADCTAASTGGLLRTMGAFGILGLKDLGSILSMNKDSRAGVLAALREVYDGKWVRHVGADGGRELSWTGKCGLVGGSTPAVDQHYALISALGERFVYLRMPEAGRLDRGRLAVGRMRAKDMRRDLAAAVGGLLSHVALPTDPPGLSDAERDRLVHLADLTAVCRTAVDRGYTDREIVGVPPPEECTRLGIVFRQLLAAFPSVGIGPDRGWDLLTRLAIDSIPPVRRRVLGVLSAAPGELKTSDVARALELPTTSVRRALEELHCHRVVDLHEEKRGDNNAVHRWRASTWLRETMSSAHVPGIRKEGPTLNDDETKSTESKDHRPRDDEFRERLTAAPSEERWQDEHGEDMVVLLRVLGGLTLSPADQGRVRAVKDRRPTTAAEYRCWREDYLALDDILSGESKGGNKWPMK
jgi:predicted ArsR family transcriptional regulator